MKALLWKDFHVNRPILILGLSLLLAPYLLAVGWIWYDSGLLQTSGVAWAAVLTVSAQSSLIASQLTVLILGGNVIAAERRDRSAEFLCYLPPTRAAILTSKALLALLTMAAIWGLSLIMLEAVIPGLAGDGSREQLHADFGTTLQFAAAVGLLLFGMSWFGSSMLESPTYSVAIGAFTAMGLPLGLNLVRTATGWPAHGEQFENWALILCVVFGLAGFAGGWAYYLRRVEP